MYMMFNVDEIRYKIVQNTIFSFLHGEHHEKSYLIKIRNLRQAANTKYKM